MKIELEKKKLDFCISSNAIAIGSGTDIFSHFVFRFSEGLLEIVSSNGRAGVLTKLVIPKDLILEEDLFAVEAWRVREWSSASNSEFITLEVEEGHLILSDDLGRVSLPCTSASLFPMWEKTYQKAKSTEYRVSAPFLKDAFQWVKGFIAEDVESERPEISVAESREGCLASTNGLVLSSVTSPVFKKLELRIHGKDFSTLIKFISSCKDDPVTVSYCEDAMFFEREDGTLYFLQKPPTPMEEYVFEDENDFVLKFKRKDFISAMKSLSAAMDRDNKFLQISREENNLLSISDGSKRNRMKISCEVEEHTEKYFDFFKTGFNFNYPFLTRMLNLLSEEEVSLGLVIKERNSAIVGGVFNLKEEREEGTVEYSTDMVWRAI